MGKNKIDTKTAEVEFDRFVELWDIDNDIEDMDEEDRTGFLDQKRRIVKAIKKGRVAVTEEGGVTYTLAVPVHETQTITLVIPKGRDYMQMDRYKERQSMHKLQAFMAAMSGKSAGIFSSMDGRDIKFCMAVVTLFFAS